MIYQGYEYTDILACGSCCDWAARFSELHLEIEAEVQNATVCGVSWCRRLTLDFEIREALGEHCVVYALLPVLITINIVHGIFAFPEEWLELHQFLDERHPEGILLIELQIESIIQVVCILQ